MYAPLKKKTTQPIISSNRKVNNQAKQLNGFSKNDHKTDSNNNKIVHKHSYQRKPIQLLTMIKNPRFSKKFQDNHVHNGPVTEVIAIDRFNNRNVEENTVINESNVPSTKWKKMLNNTKITDTQYGFTLPAFGISIKRNNDGEIYSYDVSEVIVMRDKNNIVNHMEGCISSETVNTRIQQQEEKLRNKKINDRGNRFKAKVKKRNKQQKNKSK